MFERTTISWLAAEAKKLEEMVMNIYGVPLAAAGGEVVEDIFANLLVSSGMTSFISFFLHEPGQNGLRCGAGSYLCEFSHILAEYEPAPLAKNNVQFVELAESGCYVHEALGGLAMVKGKRVGKLVQGDLGQAFIIDAF